MSAVLILLIADCRRTPSAPLSRLGLRPAPRLVQPLWPAPRAIAGRAGLRDA